jgi:Tfp pilus assembly protein PilV
MLTSKPSLTTRAARQRGVTLIEALVALVVMSFGMIALVGLMGNLRRSGDLAKQRGEAVRLAQSELETLRSFSLLTSTAPDVITFNESIVASTRTVTPANSNTSFTISRVVDPITVAGNVVAKSVRVMVTWTDRTGETGSTTQAGTPQSVTMDSVIARVDPSFAGSVTLQPPPGGTRQPAERHPAIPVTAKDLGNHKSVFRPSALGSDVWVFNNITGVIIGKCTIPAGTPVSTLTPESLESCNNDTVGYLLSGTVRFASGTGPASPSAPNGTAIHIDNVEIVSGTYTLPQLGPGGVPVKDSAGNVVMLTYTVTPPSYQCFNDSPSTTPSTQTLVNYHCIVYPGTSSPPTWSGKVVLTGFTVGSTAADYRVCRYSADYNGNGSAYITGSTRVIDNYEHPAVYVNVPGSLVRQNFLVVPGDLSCPTAPAVNPSAGVFVDYSTVQQQP